MTRSRTWDLSILHGAARATPMLLPLALASCSSSPAVHEDASRIARDASPDALVNDAGAADAAAHRALDGAESLSPETDGAIRDAGSFPESDAATGDGGFVCHGPGARFATGVIGHQWGPGQDTGQNLFPTPVLGPPEGGGACQGSTDTISLGNGGWIALEFAGNEIVDGPGPDFIVFENPFEIDCDPSNIFAELGTVSVSEDGVTWKDFPCTATQPPYGLCSGWHVVYANAETNTIDPTDPAVAGGDAYDLADIGVHVARYVKVTDRPDLVGENGVYDLDAVSIVHPMCP